jgi:hypothetical protein
MVSGPPMKGAQMAKIEILVGIRLPVGAVQSLPPANPVVGGQHAFDDDLVLKRYNNRTPGDRPNDLPKAEAQRFAGSHSGTVTLLRIAAPGDRFYPQGALVLQYVATYRFRAVPNTPLQKGQVTAQGVSIFRANGDAFEPPVTFAITGGTEAYESARGQIVEGVPNADDRLLKIEI